LLAFPPTAKALNNHLSCALVVGKNKEIIKKQIFPEKCNFPRMDTTQFVDDFDERKAIKCQTIPTCKSGKK
jgi:hypothetical protein